MKLTMRIDIYSLLFFLLLLLRIMSINEEITFIIALLFLLILVFRHKSIYIPKVSGLKIYIFFIIYAFLIGILQFSVKNIIRDCFYLLPTVVWIFIGYYFAVECRNNNRLLKILYLYGGINAIMCTINFLIHFSLSFNNLRIIFGVNVYDIGFILPIMIYEIYFNKQKIFTRRMDTFFILMMAIQICMSFGRIAILVPLIILIVLLFCELNNKTNSKRAIKGLFIFLLSVTLLIVSLLYILPEDISQPFLNKIINSFQEIESGQEFNSTTQAMSNWRAYEIQASINQWKESNIIVKIIGSGLGKGTEVIYVPYSWNGILENNELPILHNGFFSLLSKGGIFAVLTLVWIFIGNIFVGRKYLRIKGCNQINAGIFIAINCGAIANTYVVRGPVQQGAFLVWGVLMGWMSYKIRRKDMSVERKIE